MKSLRVHVVYLHVLGIPLCDWYHFKKLKSEHFTGVNTRYFL